jgi:flagellar hook-associated protein 3 FlgL
MQPISTSANWSSALLNLTQAEQQQNTAQNQVSTGKVSQELSGYGQGAESIATMQGSQTRLQGFISSGNALTQTLTDQSTALGQVASGGAAARAAVADAISSGSASGLMQALQTQYQQVVGGLNAKSNGVYIFGGGETNQPPVAVTTVTNLIPLASPPTAAFQNGQFVSSSQIDESTTIQTGQLANNVGTSLFTVFQNIAAYDAGPNGPLNGQLSQTQISFLQSQLSQFDAADSTVTSYRAQNGAAQQTVNNAITDQQKQSTTLQNMIGDKTNVDMSTALSNLAQAQNAVQASAQVLAALQNDSLLKVLPVA